MFFEAAQLQGGMELLFWWGDGHKYTPACPRGGYNHHFLSGGCIPKALKAGALAQPPLPEQEAEAHFPHVWA